MNSKEINNSTRCTDICNYNNECIMVKDNYSMCHYCGARGNLKSKVQFADYSIGEKLYLIDNGGGGHRHSSFELIGVFSEKTEALEMLCEENLWGIKEIELNKIKKSYLYPNL